MAAGGARPDGESPDPTVWDRDLDAPWPKASTHPTSDRARWTLGGWLIRIAIAGALLSLPALVGTVGGGLFVSSLIALGLVVALASMPGGLALRRRCPSCARPTLRRIARHHRYFRCSQCRARVKLGPEGSWMDASGPDDDPRYRSRAESRRWSGFAVPVDLNETTSGKLLSNKRSRGGSADLDSQATEGPPSA